PIPKLEVCRESVGKPLLHPRDPEIVAVATDGPLATALPVLPLGDPDAVATFILHQVSLEARRNWLGRGLGGKVDLWTSCASVVDRRWIVGLKVVKKQILLGMLGAALGICTAATVFAQSGFYGGVSMRDHGAESGGLMLGDQPLAWSRFTTPVSDDADQRSLVFGGYRWKNDLAVEAAFNTADKYALRPSRAGLTVGPGLGLTLGDFATRTWNA